MNLAGRKKRTGSSNSDIHFKVNFSDNFKYVKKLIRFMKKKLLLALVSGMVITIITGLIDVTGGLLGATNYGLPLAWLSTPVLANPITEVLWTNFIIDVLIWSTIVFLVLHFLRRGK